MEDLKPWYLSKGIWGSLAVIVAAGLQSAGYTVDSAELTSVTDQVLAVVIQCIQVTGATLALWGRIAATKRIK